jgi:hypothetical protein
MSERIENNFLEKIGDELALATGYAVWAFARLESLTRKYMKMLSKEDLDALVSELSFMERIKVIRKLVERFDGLEDEKEKAKKCLNRASEFAGKRNLIAHNEWQISIVRKTRVLNKEIWKHSKPSGIKIGLDEVRLFTENTEKFSAELEDAMQPFLDANDPFKHK